MKDHVDKSMGIVTRIAEVLTGIKDYPSVKITRNKTAPIPQVIFRPKY
jgi:hypothetical protein